MGVFERPKLVSFCIGLHQQLSTCRTKKKSNCQTDRNVLNPESAHKATGPQANKNMWLQPGNDVAIQFTRDAAYIWRFAQQTYTQPHYPASMGVMRGRLCRRQEVLGSNRCLKTVYKASRQNTTSFASPLLSSPLLRVSPLSLLLCVPSLLPQLHLSLS